MRIKISFYDKVFYANLEETPTTKKTMDYLPFESTAEIWGEEVYFETPIKASLEEGAQEVIPPGTVCFWTQGNALAIPYGPTPASRGTECRLVTKCNVLGKIEGDPRALAAVQAGDKVRVERVSSKQP